MEQFLNECLKLTKPKVITLTDHKEQRQLNQPIKFEAVTCSRQEARENERCAAKQKPKLLPTLTNHKGHRQCSEPIKTRSKYMKLIKTRENERGRVTIGFGLTSGWWRKKREVSKPVTVQNR